MDTARRAELKKNPKRLFWIQVLLSVTTFNVVASIYYVRHGMTLSQLLASGVVWSVANILSDIPSSVIADRWGRRPTIAAGLLLSVASTLVWMWAPNVLMLFVGFFLNGMGWAFFNGVGEAMLYDTVRELEEESSSFSHLASYSSAQNVAKIAAPLVGALIASGLTDVQCLVLLGIDGATTLAAVCIALRLVEPNHRMDIESKRLGMFRDAFHLIRGNRMLMRAMVSRAMFFIAALMVWRVHQNVFVSAGLPLIVLGIAWSFTHATIFVLKQKSHTFVSYMPLHIQLNGLNSLTVLLRAAFFLSAFLYPHPYVLAALFLVGEITTATTQPMYAEFFNKRALSHNRASTLSLFYLVKSVMDIPLLFIASALAAVRVEWMFFFSFLLAIGALALFRMPSHSDRSATRATSSS